MARTFIASIIMGIIITVVAIASDKAPDVNDLMLTPRTHRLVGLEHENAEMKSRLAQLEGQSDTPRHNSELITSLSVQVKMLEEGLKEISSRSVDSQKALEERISKLKAKYSAAKAEISKLLSIIDKEREYFDQQLAMRDREILGLRAIEDKDFSEIKLKYSKELNLLAEMLTAAKQEVFSLKNESGEKSARIAHLEETLKNVTAERDTLMDVAAGTF